MTTEEIPAVEGHVSLLCHHWYTGLTFAQNRSGEIFSIRLAAPVLGMCMLVCVSGCLKGVHVFLSIPTCV